jgi:hypothetical protein
LFLAAVSGKGNLLRGPLPFASFFHHVFPSSNLSIDILPPICNSDIYSTSRIPLHT